MSKRNSRAAKAARRAARSQHRAQAVAATPDSPKPRRRAVLDVRLDRIEGEDSEGSYVSWAAEWGLRDDETGVEDGNEDVHQLVSDIIEDVRQSWGRRYDLALEWEIGGDAPAGKTVEDMIAEAGVTLPTTLPRD